MTLDEIVAGYEAAYRAADTRPKRFWVAAEAARRGETPAELCGLLRSTYPEGYREAAEQARVARAAARDAEAATPSGVPVIPSGVGADFGADFE